ncbi:Uroporphyrinogen decarboxylase [Methanosarcinaceae archaeon Ag5]|uniref:Uroporphyrinogen decarboxylase n=1 Tax=Methanolapillus africanus TaxID=3028297 RepID=A0AAE4SD22_9EURY|nr:Uroporphyrinogen decarboxylase [Methanosarcinaceae archaeon Ag5]
MVSEMTPTRRTLAAVLGGRVDYVPPANPLAQTTVELMKHVGASWPKAHYDAKMMADLAAAPYDVCGIEAARPQFDISLEAEVLGCPLDWNKPDRPPVAAHAYTDPKEVTWADDLANAKRVPVVLEAISILRERYSGMLPIIPVITAPFTVAGHIAGVENLVRWTRTDPEKAHAFIDAATDFVIEYGKLQVEAGAHILFPADPSASGDLISGETYEEFVLPAHQRMAREVSAPKILHMCGNTSKLLPYIKKSGMDCFSFDAVPVWYCRQVLGNSMSILGSLDVIDLMPNGTPQDVYNRTQECILQGTDVVGTACDVSFGTSLDNLKAYVRACKETPVPKAGDIEDTIREIGVGIGRYQIQNNKNSSDCGGVFK